MYLFEPNADKAVGFEFLFVQPRTIVREGDQFVQYVPEDVATERRVSRYIRLSQDRILIFQAPSFIRPKLTNVMESLAVLSTLLIPDFALETVHKRGPRAPYDSSTHVKAHKLALAEAAKPVGWNARGLFEGEALEYYTLRRQLLFERFKIEMRNDILSILNHGLARVGSELGFSAQLRIDGLPTIGEVEAAQRKLAEGRCPFKQVLEPFSLS